MDFVQPIGHAIATQNFDFIVQAIDFDSFSRGTRHNTTMHTWQMNGTFLASVFDYF